MVADDITDLKSSKMEIACPLKNGEAVLRRRGIGQVERHGDSYWRREFQLNGSLTIE